MTDLNPDVSGALGRYQQEVVRWNRQINLVSRQGTLGRVASLIHQCRSVWQELDEVILAEWDDDTPVGYFDLGSGGGLPGYVWHQMLGQRFNSVGTWLVEPREKRAWFLERLNAIDPKHPLSVWRGRWGETAAVEDGGGFANILISLKALHLSDPVVLAGLSHALAGVEFLPGGRVVVARFYPPEQKWDGKLADELGFGTKPLICGGVVYTPLTRQVLVPNQAQPAGASLVVCVYELSERQCST